MQAQAVGLDALLDFLSDCALMTAGVEVGAESPVDAVRLVTLHGSKGLEFNTVCIVGAHSPASAVVQVDALCCGALSPIWCLRAGCATIARPDGCHASGSANLITCY